MRNDTAKRIKEYNKRLPKLKERLVAALVLLLVGTMMLTTVSFAWVTLSRKPEVSNITSSIASNGNLEIALASGTLRNLIIPGATQLGDGNLPILSGNKTWGNLINLSDPSYGLGNLVLRPAVLNRDDLLLNPLKAKDYTSAGRPIADGGDFRYAKWQPVKPDDPESPWEFVITDELGVRAISSTIMAESSGVKYEYSQKMKEAKNALETVKDAYYKVLNNYDIIDNREKDFVGSLSYVMGTYMTESLKSSNPSVDSAHMQNCRDLFRAFAKILELEQEAVRQLANVELFIYALSIDPNDYHTVYKNIELQSFDALKKSVESGTTYNGFKLGSGVTGNASFKSMVAQMVKDMNNVVSAHEELSELCDRGNIKWADDGLNTIVAKFVNISTCTLDGTPVVDLKSQATSFIGKEKTNAVITNGILVHFEQRTGAHMDLKEVPVSATYVFTLKLKANIVTSATNPSYFQINCNNIDSKNYTGATELAANDTYGFAIDFWVRTNAAGSFLTLQGNVITQSIEVDAKGEDNEGNEVQLYTVTVNVTDDNGEEITYSADLYQKNEKWYFANSHQEYTADPNNPPKKKVNIVQNVVGYEGDNRVWEDNAFISIDSTTQGSGSCYVFYYNSPEDMERSLKLLTAMKVAFIDEDGTLLAEGYMDTENAFFDVGKVVVPLRLNDTSIAITNPDGSETLAITALEQNVAKLITAIVYLDGNIVENKDVLAASEVQGQLNIQFGSTIDFNAMPNEKLASQFITVSAQVETSQFEYAGQPLNTNVTVNVGGSTPSMVSAYFVRQISETQAIPMNGTGEIMSFNDAGGGKWTSNYTFTSPGTYVIRSVWIDGVEYDLKPDQRPKVEVKGFAVQRIQWQSGESKKSFMTAASAISDKVVLTFTTSDSMPRTVEGRFMGADGAVNVKFTRNLNSTSWTGDVTFLSSGEYKLEFLYFDNAYYPVDTSMQIVAEIYLGMKVAVYTDSPIEFLYDPEQLGEYERNLYMKIKIMDNTGKEMRNLSNIHLYYSYGANKNATDGLHAEMQWNQSTGYYEGIFQSRAGDFKFFSVMVGDSTITTATTAPRFIIQSKDPPEFKSSETKLVQYIPNGGAEFVVVLEKDEGIVESNVVVVIYKRNSDGTDSPYEGTVNVEKLTDGRWSIEIPSEGKWVLKGIDFVGIYKDGNITTENNPHSVTFDEIVTTVYEGIKVSMKDATAPTDLVFGKDDNGNIVGEFLQEYAIDANAFGTIKILSSGGSTLPNISSVRVVYKHKGDSQDKGEYTINESVSDIAIVLISDDGIHFAPDSSEQNLKKLKCAGTYEFKELQITFAGGSDTLTSVNGIVRTMTIYSVAPSVKITNASNHKINGASTNSTYSADKATVYFGQTDTKHTLGCEEWYETSYDHPTVTITLSGFGNAANDKKATLTFARDGGGTVHLYTSAAQEESKAVTGYTWTKDGDVKMYVGLMTTSNAVQDASKTAAKTLKATELTLTDGTFTYTVDVEDITISNPS